MEYRQDPDLEFLKHCSADDLDPLVAILTQTKKGKGRWTQQLTKHPRFQENSPDHTKYSDLIAAEVQCFGANTLVTLARRGQGILYREILMEVCDKLKVNYNKESSTSVIEWNLLMKVLKDSFEHTSADDLRRIIEEMDIPTTDFTAEAAAAAIQAAIRAGKFPAYRVAVIVANAVLRAIIGRGIPFVVNAALTRVMGILAGPIGWVLTTIWTIVDIAGPAYRVTIPAVIYVAYLRLKQNEA